uniref:Uncharacterized protein n=1 Tax=Rhizophora mucronata TaxID=61149 RepID=A0A2P2QBP3_RHIMU
MSFVMFEQELTSYCAGNSISWFLQFPFLLLILSEFSSLWKRILPSMLGCRF